MATDGGHEQPEDAVGAQWLPTAADGKQWQLLMINGRIRLPWAVTTGQSYTSTTTFLLPVQIIRGAASQDQ